MCVVDSMNAISGAARDDRDLDLFVTNFIVLNRTYFGHFAVALPNTRKTFFSGDFHPRLKSDVDDFGPSFWVRGTLGFQKIFNQMQKNNGLRRSHVPPGCRTAIARSPTEAIPS